METNENGLKDLFQIDAVKVNWVKNNLGQVDFEWHFCFPRDTQNFTPLDYLEKMYQKLRHIYDKDDVVITGIDVKTDINSNEKN